MAGFVDDLQDFFSGGHLSQQEQDQIDALNSAKDRSVLSKSDLYNPVNAQMLGPSSMESMQIDPRYLAAQNDALTSMQGIANQGGLTAVDRARQNQINEGIRGQAQGAAQSALMKQAQQGVTGGGGGLQMQLNNNSQAANGANNAGVNLNATAMSRALDAMSGAGSLAGGIGAQQYSRAMDLAKTRDDRNRFNLMNQQQQANTNADQSFRAATGANNSYNARQNAMQGAYDQNSQYQGQAADRNNKFWSGLADTGMSLGADLIPGGSIVKGMFGGGGSGTAPTGMRNNYNFNPWS